MVEKIELNHLLFVKDVARVLHTSASNVRRLVSAGEIPALFINGSSHMRIRASDVNKYIENLGVQNE